MNKQQYFNRKIMERFLTDEELTEFQEMYESSRLLSIAKNIEPDPKWVAGLKDKIKKFPF